MLAPIGFPLVRLFKVSIEELNSVVRNSEIRSTAYRIEPIPVKPDCKRMIVAGDGQGLVICTRNVVGLKLADHIHDLMIRHEIMNAINQEQGFEWHLLGRNGYQ